MNFNQLTRDEKIVLINDIYDGITYKKLKKMLGSDNQIMDLCRWVEAVIMSGFDTGPLRSMDFPSLRQGDADDAMHEGQPVVYDGVFKIRDKKLSYIGMSDCHGEGINVSRTVKKHDIIIF